MSGRERDKRAKRQFEQWTRQHQEEQERRRQEQERRQQEQAALAERSTKVLPGEVKPIPPGKSDEQTILTIPFAGTIMSVSYTPNNYLHVGQQDTVYPLRNIELHLRRPQRPDVPVAVLSHRQIMLYPKEELHLEGGDLLDVEGGDELVWRSEPEREFWSREVARDTGQKDSGDPGGVVKVVVAVADWLREA
jgi:hypothetical protein